MSCQCGCGRLVHDFGKGPLLGFPINEGFPISEGSRTANWQTELARLEARVAALEARVLELMPNLR